MCGMLAVTCEIDMTGLRAGIEAARHYTKRTVPQVSNTCAYSVALAARDGARSVSAERIDAAMGTVVEARIGKRGRYLSTKSSKGRILVSGKSVLVEGEGKDKMVPRAAAIIAARANPGSEYNKLTASRWALSRNPFKGVTAAAGRQAMANLVHRMLAARRSSSKYLLAGWLPAISILFPHVQHKFLKKGDRPDRKGKVNFDLGTATVATEANPVAMIENSVGMEGKTGPKANQALILYNASVLQQAVDGEGAKQMQWALDQANKGLASEVEKHWK